MKAEFREFNGEWIKDCPCGKYYSSDSLGGLSHFFRKDKLRADGLDSMCKNCRKEYYTKNKGMALKRWKEYYAPGTENRKRHTVRNQTRKKHGSAKKHKCSMCDSPAKEWHHITYNVDNVVPVCEKCHSAIT